MYIFFKKKTVEAFGLYMTMNEHRHEADTHADQQIARFPPKKASGLLTGVQTGAGGGFFRIGALERLQLQLTIR